MDPELIAYLDERFHETSQQIKGLREETSQRFDKMEEQLRLTDVKVEDLRGQIQVVAEGVAAGNESLKDFRETVHLEFRDNKIQTSLFLKNMSERVRALELRAGRPEV